MFIFHIVGGIGLILTIVEVFSKYDINKIHFLDIHSIYIASLSKSNQKLICIIHVSN